MFGKRIEKNLRSYFAAEFQLFIFIKRVVRLAPKDISIFLLFFSRSINERGIAIDNYYFIMHIYLNLESCWPIYQN